MRVAIDKVGRIVVPEELGDRYHLRAGTAMEIEPAGEGILLPVLNREPSLVEKDGILRHHGLDSDGIQGSIGANLVVFRQDWQLC